MMFINKYIHQLQVFGCLQKKQQVLNSSYQLAFSLQRHFSLGNTVSQKVNVLKMQLRQFNNYQQSYSKHVSQFNDLQKYMIVKRKSMLTGGRIPELKGLAVQNILKESSQKFMKELDNYSTLDIIDLILLDHSIFKLNQFQLVKFISSQQRNGLTNQEYIFLVKSSLFCQHDRKCEKELMKHVKNILQNTKEYIQLSPYTACQLLIIYYQMIKKQNNLFDKENNFYNKKYDEQLNLERQFRAKYQIQGQINNNKLLYEVVIEKTLEMTPSSSQILELISELVYIGQFKREDLLQSLFNSIDVNALSLQELTNLFINTTSRNINVNTNIYETYLSKIQQSIEQEQKQSEIQELSSNQRENYIFLKDHTKFMQFLQGDQQSRSPSLQFEEDINQGNNFFNIQTKVDCLWILVRNFNLSNEWIYQNLFKSLQNDITSLQIKHLLSLIQCFIGYQMNKNISFLQQQNEKDVQFQSFAELININQAVQLLNSRLEASKQKLTDKQKCSLYLNLIYLINSNQIQQNSFNDTFLSDLYQSYQKYAIKKDNTSKTEDKFMKAFEYLQEQNFITEPIERGILIDNIYFVDFVLGSKKIVEINGDVHHNKQTQSTIRQNYLQKLFYLKFRDYQVFIIDSKQYLPIIDNAEEIQKLLAQTLVTN